MADDHDGLDIESIRLEIARIAPEFERAPVARLGEGMDSLAVLVDHAFVFRFAKHPEAAEGLRREIALLPRLAPTLPLDVPRFAWVGESSTTGLPFVAYSLIRGEPLHRPLYESLPKGTRDRVLGDLVTFLAAVHDFPVHEAAACGVTPLPERAGYVEEFARAREHVFPRLTSAVRLRVEAKLDAFLQDDANFAYTPTLLHGDLWPEHVLVSPAEGRLAGIIDFADVSLGDPDHDLVFLARTLGPGFLADLVRHDPHADPARLARKVPPLALFNALDDIGIGLDRGDRSLVDSGLADLTTLSDADFRS